MTQSQLLADMMVGNATVTERQLAESYGNRWHDAMLGLIFLRLVEYSPCCGFWLVKVQRVKPLRRAA